MFYETFLGLYVKFGGFYVKFGGFYVKFFGVYIYENQCVPHDTKQNLLSCHLYTYY